MSLDPCLSPDNQTLSNNFNHSHAFWIILLTTSIGSYAPLTAIKSSSINSIFKFFGIGTIIATGFVHLLQPANETLTSQCLTDSITGFPWAFTICLLSIFILFFVELILDDYIEHDGVGSKSLISLTVLEGSIILHSVFIGLAVSFNNSSTLAWVIAFHQMFEGFSLTTRILENELEDFKITVLLITVFTLTTPLSILLGLNLQIQYGSTTYLIVSGIIDSISSGVLIYTGLIELMTTEFMVKKRQFQSLSKFLKSYTSMVLGALIMSILGKWA